MISDKVLQNKKNMKTNGNLYLISQYKWIPNGNYVNATCERLKPSNVSLTKSQALTEVQKTHMPKRHSFICHNLPCP